MLAVVYLLLSFNAYACLLPMSGGAVMEQGSDCAKPQEQPAGRLCDAFKSLGVQTILQSAEPLFPDSREDSDRQTFCETQERLA